MTLDETGMIDALMADYYFMSTKTMTIDGELVNKDVAEAVYRHFYLSICLATILYMISCYPSSASSFSVIQTGFFGISILCTRNFLWRLSPVQEL